MKGMDIFPVVGDAGMLEAYTCRIICHRLVNSDLEGHIRNSEVLLLRFNSVVHFINSRCDDITPCTVDVNTLTDPVRIMAMEYKAQSPGDAALVVVSIEDGDGSFIACALIRVGTLALHPFSLPYTYMAKTPFERPRDMNVLCSHCYYRDGTDGCDTCGVTMYCSKECQSMHRTIHKGLCKATLRIKNELISRRDTSHIRL